VFDFFTGMRADSEHPLILAAMLIGQAMVDHVAARGRYDAVVELNRPLCREHFLLRFRVDASGPMGRFPATRPGQFVQLGCRPPDCATDFEALMGGELTWSPDAPPQPHQPELCQRLAMLRRPFSLAGRGDDANTTWLDVIHRVVGVGTDWLSHLNPGDAIDLIGPLGNWFDLKPDKSLALLVGGGVGLPPMFYLAEALAAAGWDAVAFVGAMSRDLLAVTFDDHVGPDATGKAAMCVQEFARHRVPTVVTTDDGSLGRPGRITVGLQAVLEQMSPDDRARAVVYTCGPEPMMHAAATLAAAHDVDCQVCLEQAMACGMATCQSCVVKIDAAGSDVVHGHIDGRPWRYRFACTDGPVFEAGRVVW